MAQPPREQQWTVDPPPEAQWFSDALAQMNSFISAVTFALTKQLSRSDNFRSQIKVLKLDTANTNNFPLSFDCTLQAQPEEIRVAQVKGGTPSGPVSAAHWELVSGATIRLYDITGLAANTQYEVTLIIE